MRTVLCYGDSNTWGYLAPDGARLGRWERWPGVLQRALGDDVHVVEAGLNGRTTVFDVPEEANRSGLAFLPVALETHAPVDVLILALGVNDLFLPYPVTAWRIAESVGALVDAARRSEWGPGGGPPEVLVIAPPPLGALGDQEPWSPNGVEESKRFAAEFRRMARERGCDLLETEFLALAEPDGVHLDPEGHVELGGRVAASRTFSDWNARAATPSRRSGPLSERPGLSMSIFDLCHYPFETDPAAFDPARAKAVYDDHLAQWTAAERLGFDGVFLTEHHFTAYNLLPSPNVMLAALAARTAELRLGIMINVVPFHQPVRLAEEGAMLDVLSGGRLEFGVGRGIDFQEVSKLRMEFDELRPRFEEGVEILLKAWTQERFSHDGEFHAIGETAIYPRPLQQPHPPLWVAAESPATIEWTASRGFGMATIFLPTPLVREKKDHYLRAAANAGQPADASRFMLVRNVYVAPTDEEAVADAEPALTHMLILFKDAAVPPDLSLLPDSYAFHREAFRAFEEPPEAFSDVIDAGLVLCGSPQTVRRQLQEQVDAVGLRQLSLLFAFGNLPDDKVQRSMRLFATDVMPFFDHGSGASTAT
jgi:alkanesulfonate monooxygenase SsuD/methylene tetrahydromethanopterin reductase-like flavin-dependent oxidoreductase (luciferase family)/lysophospholipase L1-like esterase